MAKYNVTYSCGHSGEVQLFGPHDERERKLAWYSHAAVCPDCYQAQQKAEEAKLTEGLIELAGTEKQVTWANGLRARLVKELNERHGSWGKDKEKRDKLFALLAAAINQRPEAKWWIDSRDDLVRAIAPIWQDKAREAGLV